MCTVWPVLYFHALTTLSPLVKLNALMVLLLLVSHVSRVRLCVTPQTAAHQAPHPWDSPGKNTGVGCHFLLQCMKVKVKSLSHARLFETSWTAAYQAPLSMVFSRQEYWSGVPLPSPTDGAIKTQLAKFAEALHILWLKALSLVLLNLRSIPFYFLLLFFLLHPWPAGS